MSTIAGSAKVVRSLPQPVPPEQSTTMKTFLLWCLLFVLCWPLALIALVAWPFVWLLALPFRLVGITFGALFSFLRALLLLPARLLGVRQPVNA
jgi:hypothetical protein